MKQKLLMSECPYLSSSPTKNDPFYATKKMPLHNPLVASTAWADSLDYVRYATTVLMYREFPSLDVNT
jgi:hypothetical protein